MRLNAEGSHGSGRARPEVLRLGHSLCACVSRGFEFRSFTILQFRTCAAALILCLTTLFAQELPELKNSAIHPLPVGYKFPDTQRLVFEAEWRLFNAGTAVLEISSNGGQQHVHGTADSSGAISLLFKVRDRFDSWFDSRSLCSTRIIKHTEEGRHRRDTQISFDYKRGQAVLDETNLKTNERKHEENAVPGCATDVLSGVFYGATLPLTVGDQYTFPLNDGNKTVDVIVHVEAREDVKTPLGTYHTIRVQPEPASGPLRQKGKIWVWYTDDGQHTPVQVRGRMYWGNLNLSLVRIEKVIPTSVSAAPPAPSKP